MTKKKSRSSTRKKIDHDDDTDENGGDKLKVG